MELDTEIDVPTYPTFVAMVLDMGAVNRIKLYFIARPKHEFILMNSTYIQNMAQPLRISYSAKH